MENYDNILKNMNLKFRNIDNNKLILAIVKSTENLVLMTAFMNEESLKKTLETGYMHYYSTSRQKLWKKGEESGNIQKVLNIYRDCDGDALLFEVEQTGWACHEGYMSCFHNKIQKDGSYKSFGTKFD
ncbi:phosphoribosyl-AMP cyclohydrolase [Methanococcus voltae]|uniref:Phosphoribosyl-AMP cyclohydrolase n=2 Tax=Methanococcus voltae TaxID=2188 RepID=A0A8J7RKR3_METVO|nr:phosphoribosyl-AMP cyclohydrolase [Methanococcus voltae]MBP2172428.1 phosphoribosyl-AMP cyclohydrolase [Methanococcus voltae]MBP2200616.1 phosphoribosyl-AMP cyclohydrolase [Methanococcus voltae]MCS3921341.1 phosphoribosyl-AMP cyclohydrolase [Methanococcus voltae PS]